MNKNLVSKVYFFCLNKRRFLCVETFDWTRYTLLKSCTLQQQCSHERIVARICATKVERLAPPIVDARRPTMSFTSWTRQITAEPRDRILLSFRICFVFPSRCALLKACLVRPSIPERLRKMWVMLFRVDQDVGSACGTRKYTSWLIHSHSKRSHFLPLAVPPKGSTFNFHHEKISA